MQYGKVYQHGPSRKTFRKLEKMKLLKKMQKNRPSGNNDSTLVVRQDLKTLYPLKVLR